MSAHGLRRLLAAALLLGAAAGCGESVTGPDRIVLVTIDTLRADRVGAYGDVGARTPNLDELAEAGVRFEHAISPAPLTLPSHSSLMTGLQPPRHGVRHNSVFQLDEEIPLLAEHMSEAGYATGAFVAAFVLDGRFGLARGFDVYDDELSQRSAAPGPFSFAERRADAVVDAAIAWLDEAPERFFLWVHLFDPHAAYDPPPRYRRRVSDPYAGEIAFADAEVGRLLKHVMRRYGREDLVVAVTSDHGESMGEHNESTHSYTVYDATQRVPLILMGSELPAGRVVDRQVRLVDVAPTLLELTGAPALEEVDGRSLVPLLLQAEDPEAERVAYVETLATQLDMGWSPLLGVRTPGFKYIRAPQPELYDLREDPDETHNLALVRPEKARELDALLDEQLEGARPVSGSQGLSEGDRARLESLGYVVPEEAAFGADLGVVGGPNPRDHMLEAVRTDAARTALSEGDPQRALELMEQVTGTGMHLAQVRAHAALAAGRPELAAAVLEELREAGRASGRELSALGVAYLADDRLEEAREALEQARAADPDLAGPLRGLAFLAIRQQDLEEAETLLLEAEKLAPQPEQARVDRAILRLHQGREEEAEVLLEGIEPAFLTDPDRARRLATAFLRSGRGERASELLRRALDERPEHRQLLATYAELLLILGHADEAVRTWRRLYALAPDEPGAKNDLAWGLALARRDLDEALHLVEEAAAAMEGNLAVLDTLAEVHLARGEPERALQVADRVLSAGPDAALRPHLRYVRAAALAELGRADAARRAIETLGDEEHGLGQVWAARAAALAKRLGVELKANGAGANAGEAEEAGGDAASSSRPGGSSRTGAAGIS